MLVAPQSIANATLIPASLGWSIQLVLCGVSVDRARRILSHHKYQETRTSGVPGTRYFLFAATLLNVVYTSVTIWDTTAWQVNQNRTDDGLNSLLLPDVIGPFLAGVVGVIVPVFMAIRCWRITNKSTAFAIVITVLMATVLASLIWSCYSTYRYQQGMNIGDELFVPTQIWLFTSAAADALITIFLALHLKKMKRGFSSATDSFLDALVRLAFETSAPPALASTAAAIIFACTWQATYAWNSYYGIVPFIPSLYLLSFVYCLQSTRSRGRILSQSNQGPVTDASGGVLKAAKVHVARTNPSQDISWRPPIEWHSTIGTSSEDIESFHSRPRQETPFATYISATYETPRANTLPEVHPSSRGPRGIKLTKETEIVLDDADDDTIKPQDGLG